MFNICMCVLPLDVPCLMGLTHCCAVFSSAHLCVCENCDSLIYMLTFGAELQWDSEVATQLRCQCSGVISINIRTMHRQRKQGGKGPWPLLNSRPLLQDCNFCNRKSLQFSKVTPSLSVASSTSGTMVQFDTTIQPQGSKLHLLTLYRSVVKHACASRISFHVMLCCVFMSCCQL